MGKLNLKEKSTQICLFIKSLPRAKKIGGALLILVAGVLLYESLVNDQVLKLKALARQFHSQKKLLSYYSKLLENAHAITNELEIRQQDFAKTENIFVKEEELSEYFANFRQLADICRLRIVSLDFKPKEPLMPMGKVPFNFYQRLPFNFSVKGNSFNVMQLLQKMEYGTPICEIRSLRIKQESPDSYEVIADIAATVFISTKGRR